MTPTPHPPIASLSLGSVATDKINTMMYDLVEGSRKMLKLLALKISSSTFENNQSLTFCFFFSFLQWMNLSESHIPL